MSIVTRKISSVEDVNLLLRGGVKVGNRHNVIAGKLLGLDGLTLVFSAPSAKTVTFSNPGFGGLALLDILHQIKAEFDLGAATTEGTTALSALTMASETLTLFLDGSATSTDVVFGTESGEAPILAILNAALNPLGVTATAGGGTPGGVVLTSDVTGGAKSIQVTATGGGQAKLTMAVETVTGTDVIAAGFRDSVLSLVETTPTNGVAVNGVTSTAAALFGIGPTGLTGTVYNSDFSTSPFLISVSPAALSDGAYTVVTEE